jgi:cell division protein FtsB
MDFRVEKPKLRILPSPDERIRVLGRAADHAELFAGRLRARVQPLAERVYGFRRRLATVAVSLLAMWLFLHVMLGANGMVVYRTKRSEYHQLQNQIQQLQKENANYSEQVQQLKTDPERIEKEAREQFHYARPGEVVYVAPDPPPAPTPSSRTASR